MSDETNAMSEREAKQQAAEYVVSEAKSWHEGSPEETVKDKMKDGLDQADVSLPDDKVDEMAHDIHEGRDPKVGPAE